MKAKNRKTGEIVDIIFYSQLSAIERSSQDYVSYIDSQGVEHEKENLNYYWDFEPIDNTQDKEQHWQDVRERAAIAALKGLLSNPGLVYTSCKNAYYFKNITEEAMRYADKLVEKLKEE